MAYLGPPPSQKLATPTSQYFSGNGSATAFTLNRPVNVAEDLNVFVNNVAQQPGSGKSYTATGTTLTFDAAPDAGTNNVYVVYRGLAEPTTRLEHPSGQPIAATTGTFSSTLAVTGATTTTGGVNTGTIKEATGTTTAMTIDSTGRVLQPAKPFFHVSERNNTGSVGITGQLVFDTVVTDIGSNYDTAGFFKAPVAGIYQFNFSGMGCGNTSGAALPSNQSAHVLLQKATADDFSTGLVSFASGFSQVVSSTSFPNLSVSGSILLAANDRVRAVMGNNYIFASTNAIYDPQFSGYLVG